MPFSIRPYRRFPVHCAVTYNAGPFLNLTLAYLLGFGSLVTLLFLCSVPAHAEWVKAGDNDDFSAYVDLGTIRRNGSLVKMWGLADFKTARTQEGITLLSSVYQGEHDCAEERSRGLAYTWFSDHMGNGNAVASNSDTGLWQPVDPESMEETVLEIACGTQRSHTAAKWDLYSRNDDIGETEFANRSTIRRKGNLVRMWRLTDYKIGQANDGNFYLSAMSQVEFDCADNRLRVLAITVFTEHMGKGKKVGSEPFAYSYAKWKPVLPGTVGEGGWKIACGKQ